MLNHLKLCSVIFLFLSLSLFSQVKDSKGNLVSHAVLESSRGLEALPLLMGRGQIFTRSVSINGTAAGVFAIDTGMNISMIDESFAKELGLKQDIQGLTSANDRRRFNFFKVDSISLGRFRLKNHVMYGGNISQRFYKFKEPVVGVIGNDVLSKLPFTIDYENLILTIFSRDKFKPSGKAFELKINNQLKNLGVYSEANLNAGTPMVAAKINKNHDVDLMLDTSEEDAVLLRAHEALKYKDLKGSYKIPRIFHKNGGSKEQYSANISSVNLFEKEVPQEERNFILFPSDGTMVLNSQVGSRVLSQFKITLDYENKKVWATKFEGPIKYRNELDFAGHNELARTVRSGNTEKAKELLKDTKNRVFLGHRNETLLMLAVESKNTEMVDLLLSIGKHDIEMINSAGVTPLMHASATNQLMMINSLIAKGASVNQGDYDGVTSLHYAILGESASAVSVLIKNKANINAKMKNGMRPLSLAAAQGDLRIFSSILESGGDLRYIDAQGRNLYHAAAIGDNPDLIQVISSHKKSPEINSPNKEGMTPLMLAVKALKFKAAEALIKNGASVKTMNTKNFKSALDYALASKNKQMAELIEKAWEDTQSK